MPHLDAARLAQAFFGHGASIGFVLLIGGGVVYLLLGDLPMVYPFIVDDPGEGAAAKRRTHAVIVDHLPPPMTTADAYGPLTRIGRLVDEYYLLERTDPSKLPFLQQEIWEVIREARLRRVIERGLLAVTVGLTFAGGYLLMRGAAANWVAYALTIATMAIVMRMTRATMLEVLRQDYVRTARAKGLTEHQVIWKHALRSAITPIITILALDIGTLLGGAILTETIFSWPGIGKWMVDSIFRRDYPVVQGGLLLIATMVVFVNLAVDLIYGLINPRIRHVR
mgnify:CR=1 FL=1